jgi:hypothetical protein
MVKILNILPKIPKISLRIFEPAKESKSTNTSMVPPTSQSELDHAKKATTSLNFASMTVEQIKQWIDLKPVGNSLTAGMNIWHQKTIPQKLFGGIGALSSLDIGYWEENDPDFAKLRQSKEWMKDQVSTVLQKRVSDVVALDLRGKLLDYPA